MIFQSTASTTRVQEYEHLAMAASVLRFGLGLVFVIGGLSKLNLLLDATTHDGMVANYMGTSGYINTLFQEYLFTGKSLITPSLFLTSLSAFELFSGFALMAGFMVRPLALLYGFMLWSFVVALPVHTVPGVDITVKTYTSPAILVQIRDIALSGMMFVLFNLGAGFRSLDNKLFPQSNPLIAPDFNWRPLGLLLRVSLGIVFLVGGFFGAFHKVPNFATAQWVLMIIGLALVLGGPVLTRISGIAVIAVMSWFMVYMLNIDKSVIANLNGIKREFALTAAGCAMILLSGGTAFTLKDMMIRCQGYFHREPTEIVT